jgi:hypothetical protein
MALEGRRHKVEHSSSRYPFRREMLSGNKAATHPDEKQLFSVV